MNSIISKTESELILRCTAVEEIMQPILQKHGITLFNYYKWYFNGSVLRLSTSSHLTEHFFKKDYINKLTVPVSYLMKPKNYFIWQPKDCPEVLLDYVVNFNISNGLTIAIRYPDSIEYFAFATTVDNPSIINFYINNFDILENYCFIFKDQAKALIHECENRKITLKNPAPSQSLYLPSKLCMQLPERQLACAQLLLTGMKYKEIARELQISPRTIESHIRDLKLKLSCKNRTELIAKLLQILPNTRA